VNFRHAISQSTALIVIFVFAYAAISKWLDMQTYLVQMTRQPMPSWMAQGVVWTLPPFELMIAILAAVPQTRKMGLLLASIVMTVFTIYIILALTESLGRIPCACGGIITAMGWHAHLIFNIVLLALCIVGWWMHHRK